MLDRHRSLASFRVVRPPQSQRTSGALSVVLPVSMERGPLARTPSRGNVDDGPRTACAPRTRPLIGSLTVSDLAALLPDLSTTSWLLVVLGALIVGFSKTALPGAGTLAAGAFALAMPAKEIGRAHV